MTIHAHIDPETARAAIAEVYEALDLPPDAARLIADTLVQAELWGHPSHGLLRTFWYVKRLRSGACTTHVPEPDPTPSALSQIDGGNGMGQPIAQAAMTQAIAAAKTHGVGVVSVRNSGHFGTAMYFTKAAACAGCVGFLATNASPAMAPVGGREARVGTNPWSWAAPAGRHAPMMLDLANTAVARGKLYAAKERGEDIPLGWAVDANGVPTIDPAAGIAGAILPMAGHKGYAIGLIMDMVSGILSGSAFGTRVTGPYVETGTSGVGHLALAIDIAALRPLPEFEADMEALIAELKATPLADGSEEVLYPGEMEARSEAAARASGLSVPRNTLDQLAADAASFDLPWGIAA